MLPNSAAAAKADRRGGEGKESPELCERSETPEGTLEPAEGGCRFANSIL